MRRALFVKELRGLRPFMFVVVAVVLIDIFSTFLMPLEALSIGQRLASLHVELTGLQIVLGFALGSNLLVREIDDGTLGFLDGLPLTRAAIFTAKIKAAMLVLAVLPAALLLMNLGLHLATRESLDHALHPALLLTMFALSVLVTAVGLTAGMLLGFLRNLSWLVLVLCAIAIVLLEEPAPWLSAALNPAELLKPRFAGTSWQLPMATIWTQLGATMAFGLVAFALFMSAGKVLPQVQRFHVRRRLVIVPVVTTMLVAAVAGAAALVQRSQRDSVAVSPGVPKGVAFTPIAEGQATTTHYTFSYPALSSARVGPLIAGADKTFKDVAALLKMNPGSPIDVDLSGTTDNHAGTAYHDRIRMHVRGTDAPATLAHETAHVFAMRLAGGENGHQLDGMMVFNEGLAEWVESTLEGHKGVRPRYEFIAAIVSARRLVHPRQLTDLEALASTLDANLKYSLGTIFIDRLVARYGAVAPNKVLSALAKKDFPRDLEGYALWQTAFQLAGFDLDLVFDDYARYLRQVEPKYARQIAALPRPRGSLVEKDGDYLLALRLDLPLPEGGYPLARFRPGKSTNSVQYRTGYSALSPAGEFTISVPDKMVTLGEICFQPGLAYAGVNIFEPWVCLPVSSARQDESDD